MLSAVDSGLVVSSVVSAEESSVVPVSSAGASASSQVFVIKSPERSFAE